jgi:homoserine dehydrogenase
MEKQKEIGIGLLGFGTIGAGVVRGLQESADILQDRLGARLVLRRIADVDLQRDRGVQVDPSILTTDANEVINDPKVQIVVELIGGTGIAKDLVMKALEAGKPVVTANKALLAKYGREVFALAKKKNADIYFGASVGGGIPIIRALREGLVANHIESILGILNGTCNYILTRMENESLAFETVLKDAQKAGYAEADPALDIDGHDTAHKAAILASLAYGLNVPMESVYVDGIRGISKLDVRYAGDLGYRLKLLAVIKKVDSALEVHVHPALVPLNHVLASVSGVYNAVLVRGNLVGDSLYYGRGAGQEPTASTVLGDIADIARNLISQSPCRVPAVAWLARTIRIRHMQDIQSRYYVRLSVKDEPGVLGKVTSILGRHKISIASVNQKEGMEGGCVPVVMATHQVREKQFMDALTEINSMDFMGASAVFFRIEG